MKKNECVCVCRLRMWVLRVRACVEQTSKGMKKERRAKGSK